MKNKPSGRAGFSLVELSITVTALSVGLLGASAAVFASVRLDATTRQQQDAHRVVQSLSDEIRATPFDDLATTWSDRVEDVAVHTGRTSTTFDVLELEADSDAPVYAVQIRVGDPGGGAKPIYSTTLYVNRERCLEPTASTADGTSTDGQAQ